MSKGEVYIWGPHIQDWKRVHVPESHLTNAPDKFKPTMAFSTKVNPDDEKEWYPGYKDWADANYPKRMITSQPPPSSAREAGLLDQAGDPPSTEADAAAGAANPEPGALDPLSNLAALAGNCDQHIRRIRNLSLITSAASIVVKLTEAIAADVEEGTATAGAGREPEKKKVKKGDPEKDKK